MSPKDRKLKLVHCCHGMQNYKMTKQQEEQHTPAFVRMQQQAAAKEAEEAAEKKRVWEEEVASKKFWVKAVHLTAYLIVQPAFACKVGVYSIAHWHSCCITC